MTDPAATLPPADADLNKAVRVTHLAGETCEITVAGKRLGFVGFGSPAPINWLPHAIIGVEVTIEQRTTMVRRVRELMADKNAERAAAADLLAKLEAGVDPQPPTPLNPAPPQANTDAAD